MHANARQNRFIIQFFSFFSLFSIGEITLVFLNMLDFFQCTINFNQFKIMSSSRCEMQSNTWERGEKWHLDEIYVYCFLHFMGYALFSARFMTDLAWDSFVCHFSTFQTSDEYLIAFSRWTFCAGWIQRRKIECLWVFLISGSFPFHFQGYCYVKLVSTQKNTYKIHDDFAVFQHA